MNQFLFNMALGCYSFLKYAVIGLSCVLFNPCVAHFSKSSRYQAPDQLKSGVEDQWFIQRLDHFNGADSRVWKQVLQFTAGECM